MSDLHPNFKKIRDDIIGIDTPVTLLNGKKQPYINFDNAASTPAMRKVVDDIANFLPWYSSVHRGSGQKSRFSTELYEKAHKEVGKFVGANPKEHVVIFGKNTTDSINTIAGRLNLNKNDVVIVSSLEHHSNDLPWRKYATVKHIAMKAQGIDYQDLQKLLEDYKTKVKIVAITGASNVTGYMPDIHLIAEMAHKAGAQIFVDAAQLAPHRTINIGKLSHQRHLDYIALSAHKMYAPFGTGALIGRRDTFAQGAPQHSGGGTVTLVTKKTVDWADSPDRDEAGSPNVVGAIALASATKALTKIGMNKIAKHEAELTSYALKKLSGIAQITIFGNSNPDKTSQRTGVIAFTVNGVSHALVAAILGYEYGIGVRNGCFCAHPYVFALQKTSKQQISKIRQDLLSGDKTTTPGMVRISFGVYNTTEEIDRLIDALKQITAGKFAKYSQNKKTGDFTPLG